LGKTSDVAAVILSEDFPCLADFADETLPDSDEEGNDQQTSQNLDRAVVSRRNEVSRSKHAIQVQTSPTQAAAGLGLVATKQLKAGTLLPVKGVWFYSMEEAQAFCINNTYLLQPLDCIQIVAKCRMPHVNFPVAIDLVAHLAGNLHKHQACK